MLKENVLADLGYDSSTAEQYFDTLRRGEPLEPERSLLIALLEDAIDSYRKYHRAQDRQGRERFREAEDWLMADDSDWIFSFRNVCELLALDPEYIRRGVREMFRKAPDEKAAHSRGRGRRAA